jgi:hypothetical protein
MTARHFTVICTAFIAFQTLACAETARVLNAQLDLNANGVLDESEVRLGVINSRSPLNLPALRALPAAKQKEAVDAILQAAEFQDEKSQGHSDFDQLKAEYRLGSPPYAFDRIDPKAFGLRAIIVSGESKLDSSMKPQSRRWSAALRRTRAQTLKVLRDPDSSVEQPTAEDSKDDLFPEGALFSYKQDRLNDFSTLNATGVLGLSWHLGPNPHYDPSFKPEGSDRPVGVTIDNTRPLRNSEFFFLLSMDRSDNDKEIPEEDRAKPDSNPTEKDTLEFELGLTNLYAWSRRIAKNETDPTNVSRWGDNWLGFAALGVDGSLKLTTDSELRRRIWAGSLTFNPIWNIAGMEAWHGVGLYTDAYQKEAHWLAFRYRLNVDLIGGTVERKGSNDFNRTYRYFAYVGGNLTLELRPLPYILENRLTLLASYMRHEGISNNVDGADEFRASIRYYLPMTFGLPRQVEAKGIKDQPWIYESGKLLWALQLEYRRGEAPITLEKERSLTAGIGVAF